MAYNPGVSYTGGQAYGQMFQNIANSLGGAMVQRGEQKKQRQKYETILGALDPEKYNADTLSSLSLSELEGELQVRTVQQAEQIKQAQLEKETAQKNEAIMRREEMIRKQNADKTELTSRAAGMNVFNTKGFTKDAIPLAIQEYRKAGGSNEGDFIKQVGAVAQMGDDQREQHALNAAVQLFRQTNDSAAAQDAYFTNGGNDASALNNQLESMSETNRGFKEKQSSVGLQVLDELVADGVITEEEATNRKNKFSQNWAEGRPDPMSQFFGAMMQGGGMAPGGDAEPVVVKSQAEYEALEPGTPYIWNGVRKIKQ